MLRWTGLLGVGWALACAGTPAAPSAPPWAAFAVEGWETARIIDGRPVFVQTCASHNQCCEIHGDEITQMWASGEGQSEPILGARQDGDTLVLAVKDGEYRVRRVGEGIAWSDSRRTWLLHPPGSLPRFVECCVEVEEDPYPVATGRVVPEGEPCP